MFGGNPENLANILPTVPKMAGSGYQYFFPGRGHIGNGRLHHTSPDRCKGHNRLFSSEKQLQTFVSVLKNGLKLGRTVMHDRHTGFSQDFGGDGGWPGGHDVLFTHEKPRFWTLKPEGVGGKSGYFALF